MCDNYDIFVKISSDWLLAEELDINDHQNKVDTNIYNEWAPPHHAGAVAAAAEFNILTWW